MQHNEVTSAELSVMNVRKRDCTRTGMDIRTQKKIVEAHRVAGGAGNAGVYPEVAAGAPHFAA